MLHFPHIHGERRKEMMMAGTTQKESKPIRKDPNTVRTGRHITITGK